MFCFTPSIIVLFGVIIIDCDLVNLLSFIINIAYLLVLVTESAWDWKIGVLK